MRNVEFETKFFDMINETLEFGDEVNDRTGVGTISRFGNEIRVTISDNYIPLLTTKKIFTRSFIHETIWFLSGSTDVRYLKENNVSIWDSWVKLETTEFDADGNLIAGDIGKGGYGACWRKWEDTRVIDINRAHDYVVRGFTVLPELGNSKKLVVTRTIDQFADLIENLRNNPDSRRLIVSAWNPALLDETTLPPCHSFMQWSTRELSDHERVEEGRKKEGFAEEHDLILNLDIAVKFKKERELFKKYNVPERALSCKLTQRSVDTCVGFPFNVAQYSLLIHMVAHVVNMVGEEFIWSGGDVHIYQNHLELLEEQMSRELLDIKPTVKFKCPIEFIDEFTFDDIEIAGYESHGRLDYPVAI